MKLKNFPLLALFLMLAATSIFAQTPAPVLKDNTNGNAEEAARIGDIRGSIKRKAVFLPKPSYPREALEAGADGLVKVEVSIDAEGSVVKAKAVSGNPLLFATAEETALRSKFRKSETADPNAVETGTLVYNFYFEKAGWMKIAYDLAIVQKAPSLRFLSIPRIAKAFEKDWQEENALLAKLAEMRRVEVETQNAADDKPVLVRKTDPQTSGTLQSTMRAEIRLPIPNPPTGERIALAQNLTALLQSRLASDDSNLWKFNLGLNTAKALELARNPNEARNAAQILRQSLDIVPKDIPSETLAALQRLIEIFESGQRTMETPKEIGKELTIIFRTK